MTVKPTHHSSVTAEAAHGLIPARATLFAFRNGWSLPLGMNQVYVSMGRRHAQKVEGIESET